MLEPASDGVLTDGHGITRTVGLRGSPKDVERHSDSRVGSMGDRQIEGEGVVGETVCYIAAQLQGPARPPLSGSDDGCCHVAAGPVVIRAAKGAQRIRI